MAELETPIIYGRIISAVAGRTPAAVREVLQGTGLDHNLGKNLTGYMSNTQYEQLLRNAGVVSGDPLIALKAGSNVPSSVHGPLTLAATSSNTLRIAIKTLAHYTKLRSPYCSITLKQQAGKVAVLFSMQPVFGDQLHAALDFMISTISHSIANLGCMHPVTFKLELSRPTPDNAERYQQLLGCEVSFDQPRDALVFDDDDMDIELLGANENEFEKSVNYLRKISSSFDQSDTTAEMVVNIFIQNSGYLCTLEYAAKSMHITGRTLQRHLQAENWSFQALRDNWLGQQAKYLLQQDRLSVEVTATLLGYSDTANFRRSFKRWFGFPPGDCSKKVDG